MHVCAMLRLAARVLQQHTSSITRASSPMLTTCGLTRATCICQIKATTGTRVLYGTELRSDHTRLGVNVTI
jgi:hypothetical protein